MKRLTDNLVSMLGQATASVSSSEVGRGSDLLVAAYAAPIAEKNAGKVAGRGARGNQAAILFADIAEFAHLSARTDEDTNRRLATAIRVMMTHIADKDGRIEHLAGDAILTQFDSADSAMRCALNVQLAARQWNADLPFDRQVLFRIGVKIGDVIEERRDIHGNAVDLAACLEKLASTGGICVSESVMESLEHHPAYRFVAMGKQYVKNFSEPVQAFWIEFDSQQFVDVELTAAVKVSPVTS